MGEVRHLERSRSPSLQQRQRWCRTGRPTHIRLAWSSLEHDLRRRKVCIGTVFPLIPSNESWRERVLYSFSGGSDGVYPLAEVMVGRSGHLQGTTLATGKVCREMVWCLELVP